MDNEKLSLPRKNSDPQHYNSGCIVNFVGSGYISVLFYKGCEFVMFYKKEISFKKAGQKGVFAAYQVKGLFYRPSL